MLARLCWGKRRLGCGGISRGDGSEKPRYGSGGGHQYANQDGWTVQPCMWQPYGAWLSVVFDISLRNSTGASPFHLAKRNCLLTVRQMLSELKSLNQAVSESLGHLNAIEVD